MLRDLRSDPPTLALEWMAVAKIHTGMHWLIIGLLVVGCSSGGGEHDAGDARDASEPDSPFDVGSPDAPAASDASDASDAGAESQTPPQTGVSSRQAFHLGRPISRAKGARY